MAQCFDTTLNRYVYCSSSFSTYIAVGIILPLAILIITIIISAYLRYKRKLARREQHQISMSTVVSIHNTDGEDAQVPYNPLYPPTYTSIDNSIYEKPPSYEQTVEHLSATNVTSEDVAAVLPITVITSSSASQSTEQPGRN